MEAMTTGGEPMTGNEVDMMIEEADQDGNGKIDYKVLKRYGMMADSNMGVWKFSVPRMGQETLFRGALLSMVGLGLQRRVLMCQVIWLQMVYSVGSGKVSTERSRFHNLRRNTWNVIHLF